MVRGIWGKSWFFKNPLAGKWRKKPTDHLNTCMICIKKTIGKPPLLTLLIVDEERCSRAC
jgi:hypothetical protein